MNKPLATIITALFCLTASATTIINPTGGTGVTATNVGPGLDNGMTNSSGNRPVYNNGTATGLSLTATFTDTSSGASGSSTVQWSNVMSRFGWQAGQNRNITRLPPLGVASWFGAFANSWTNLPGPIPGITNEMGWMLGGAYQHGYQYILLDDGWGVTNLDPYGYMQLNTNLQHTFGAGTNGVFKFFNAVHTNGFKIGVYIDGGTNTSVGGYQHGMSPPYLVPNLNLWAAWGLDALKTDSDEWEHEMAAAVLSSNSYPVFLDGAVDPNYDGGASGPLNSVYYGMFNGVRVVSGGDTISYPILIQWTDVLMTNGWWKFSEPGRFIDMDYIGGILNAGYGIESEHTHLNLAALFSSPIMDDVGVGNALQMFFTNQDILNIDQDPAVICAQRYMNNVSNCDVYVKPLGTQNGPKFALGVVNRSSAVSASLSFYLTNLFPLSGSSTWSVFDCGSNGVDGTSGHWIAPVGTNQVSVSLSTNASVLYYLTPGAAMITNVVAVNFPYSMTVNVVSNGVPFTFYVPIDSMSSNYMYAAQLTNNTTQEAFEIAAAQTTVLGTRDGWLSDLDVLHLYMGGTSNSTAQNFVSQSVGTLAWTTSGVTYNANSVTGNGSSGYGASTFNPSGTSQHFQTNSAMMFSWVENTSVSANSPMMGGPDAISLRPGFTSFEPYGINAPNGWNFNLAINWNNSNGGSTAAWWMAERVAANLSYSFLNNQLLATDTSVSTSMSGYPFYFLGENTGSGSDAFFGGTIGCDGIGGALTPAQWGQMLTDLQTIKRIAGN